MTSVNNSVTPNRPRTGSLSEFIAQGGGGPHLVAVPTNSNSGRPRGKSLTEFIEENQNANVSPSSSPTQQQQQSSVIKSTDPKTNKVNAQEMLDQSGAKINVKAMAKATEGKSLFLDENKDIPPPILSISIVNNATTTAPNSLHDHDKDNESLTNVDIQPIEKNNNDNKSKNKNNEEQDTQCMSNMCCM
jgi:hypothetical protein